MLKHAWFVSAFAVAMVAMPVEAQERRVVCAWNDAECIRREQDRARREEARADERRDVDYDRGRVEYERGRSDRRERVDVDRRRGNVRHGRLPHMSSALAIRNGRGIPKDAQAWLGRGPFRVELVNRDRDRLPERATIVSTRTRETQVWVDRNNDGWADQILFYRNGRLVREVK